ncbi:UDP-N-acetylglucosamine 1-carboxyvinyltransferase [Halanaerobacter jeridensis]|uniref:UDP-N-acetylglucosamine 1-carboxyvinyltransferase n=1 Tax=Halanaerobacter jeridensis TaxID=706427 RepID=A0A938XT27_9FIRM|nr:UDP-N-acetylglucosamine 1-carboxyvinyltransferase [Halanaerobacter jeridensis]MBM7557005.1 UDP-N-acetylglucosamine 1-carboxyvinyltransferase [Halanaerobacter jeridensis]
MSQFVVSGTEQINGEISVSGAKNAALPVAMASLMGHGESVLCDIPDLRDIRNIVKIIDSLGAEVEYKNNQLTVNPDAVDKIQVPEDLAQELRASYYILGAFLARHGQAETTIPGGCDIGDRPIDLHLKGFKALGAEVTIDGTFVHIEAEKLTGAKIYLDYPSVGATMNIIMAASMAEGKTVIENAAREPEIVDLANYLNVMGAEIKGAGTDVIRIEGVEELTGTEYTIIPDRIEAGTYLIMGAVTGSELYVDNVLVEHIKPLVAKLKEMGVRIEEDVDGVKVNAKSDLKAVDVKTLPYPGFPTDLQAPFMVLLTQAEGESKVIETVFENRFAHVEELKKMGAEIKEKKIGHTAVVHQTPLTGTEVRATDLRAGAALILAGLVAEGETTIKEGYHIERGYENVIDKLRGVGIDIKKIGNS